ncbi:GNAT family N-acetyltransferase [Roseomonas sp. KE0001]|uniref:GNAT family N-acetyltransferase n=1 Tax=Roseomonas sp. KE0001 TaxID=2479201 RepID=UPI0018DFC9F8|nr:GNAT family N-acetyltransferase [Roseomonas sp. KE0001]MBI0433145.1 GNAT family N-acetyltransferase [Roseomonas sp. KE0001]
MSGPPAIEVTDAEGADGGVVLRGILDFNEAAVGPSGRRPLSVLVRDPETGAVLGGLTGRTDKGWLFIELFHLPEALRGGGLGAALLARAEAEARARGCVGAWLDSYSFQAPAFYRRQGYTEFGHVPDNPPGHTRHFFRKVFAPG